MSNFEVATDTDLGLKTTLRRYMDLPKFLDLLHFEALYLCRADSFADRLEGALFPSHRELIERAHGAGYKTESAETFYRRGRAGNYVSCWTRGNRDSMALWRLYGGTGPSVAVVTSIEQLVQVALSWNRRVVIHRVKYVEHANVKTYVVGAYTDMLQYKHVAYKYENEVRLIVPQQDGIWESNPIGIRLKLLNLNRFIRSIVISPEASPEFVQVVRDVASKYGVQARINQSSLAKVPV